VRFAPGLAALAVLAAAIGCRASGQELPSSVRIYADPSLSMRVMNVSAEFLSLRDVIVEPATDPTQADLVVSTAPEQQRGDGFAAGYWVPAVALPRAPRELTMDQLRDAVSGAITDWSSITGDPTPLRVLAPADPSPPFAVWWPDVTYAVETLPLDEIPDALAADPGALALLPLDAVHPAVRSLAVDGTNIVFGTGDLTSYPLMQEAWAVPSQVKGGKFAELLDALATHISERSAVLPPDPIVLRATGDIIPARCALAAIRATGDYTHPFLELGPWLREADVTVGSLDSSLSDVSPPLDCIETFNLAGPAAAIEGLTYSGFDVITNAANHAKDCGQIGACGDESLLATDANLRAVGITPVGSGADLADARKPGIITVKGVRFAFLGYDAIAPYYHAEPGLGGTAPLEEDYVREDVAAAKQEADVVIVMPHWGVEYTSVPTLDQQSIAAAAADAGATMIIGNHPHWVQAEQMIGDMFVAYGLGNFVFDQDWSLETQQGVAMDAVFHGAELKAIEYYPVHIWDEHQPRFADPAEAQQILERIWDASALLQ